MDIFYKECFLELDVKHGIELSKISKIFAEEFFSKQYLTKIAQNQGIYISETDEPPNIIEKLRNQKNELFPSYVLCNQFYSPDSSWSVVDAHASDNTTAVLYKTLGGFFFKVQYNFVKKEGIVNDDFKYNGIKYKYGQSNTSLLDVLQYHPRALKSLDNQFLTSCNTYTWNSTFIKYKDFLIENQYPFQCVNWKTGIQNVELQEHLKYLILCGKIISYIYVSETYLSIVLSDGVFIFNDFEFNEILEYRVDNFNVSDNNMFFEEKSKKWIWRNNNSICYIVGGISSGLVDFMFLKKFSYNIINITDKHIFLNLKNYQNHNVLCYTDINLQSTNSIHLMNKTMSKEYGSVMDTEKGLIFQWSPIEGKLNVVLNAQNLCYFDIYYAHLGNKKQDTMCENEPKSFPEKVKRYTNIVKCEKGVIVQVEKSKYIFVEF